jgi:hypothetical protein
MCKQSTEGVTFEGVSGVYAYIVICKLSFVVHKLVFLFLV